MWLETPVFKADLDAVCADRALPWAELEGKRVLVTGGTGLIGSTLISALLYYGMGKADPIRVVALVRSVEKARALFAGQLSDCPGCLEFVEGEVQSVTDIPGDVDYIVHGASPTGSLYFIQKPVETIQTAVLGTLNLLELGVKKKVAGFVYLSSMEVYGLPPKGQKVDEDHIGALSPLKVRNCYPLGKQQCECLCAAYAAEYGLPTGILRLTQTFGPGVAYNDGRVFAEFARCAIEGRDIVLKSTGETCRDYLYTADAVGAILTVLVRGERGQAYNAANESTYCSIAEMAQMVAELGGVGVRFELQDVEKLGYAPTLYMDLDTTRLRRLGWQPTTDLETMYRRMMAVMKQE